MGGTIRDEDPRHSYLDPQGADTNRRTTQPGQPGTPKTAQQADHGRGYNYDRGFDEAGQP